MREFFVGQPQDGESVHSQPISAFSVAFSLMGSLVDRAVKFEDQLQFMTIEIRNSPMDDMLPAKLQTQAPSCAKEFPRGALCRGTVLAKLLCPCSQRCPALHGR